MNFRSGTREWQVTAVAACVALVTLFAYLPALTNDFVNWDDPVNIIENVHIRSLDLNFFRWAITDRTLSYWQPLNWLTHALDYAVWGLNPVGHHLTNILLHSCVSFILVVLLARLAGIACHLRTQDNTVESSAGSGLLLAAGLTGLLFGLHPLNAESVAWVTGRPGMLSALFYLLSLYFYLGCRPEFTGGSGSLGGYLLSLLFFVCSLASKPMAVTLPLVLLLLDRYLLASDFSLVHLRRTMLRIGPYVLLAALVAGAAYFSEKIAVPIIDRMNVPLSERLLVSSQAIVLYLTKTVFPVGLLPYYEYPDNASLRSVAYLVPVIVLTAISAGCIIYRKRLRITGFVWSYFLITLLPVIGFVTVRSVFMADRYLYLPLVGPLFLCGLLAARIWERFGREGVWRRLLPVTAVAIFVVMTVLTVKQEAVWKSGMTLWSYLIDQRQYHHAMAYHNRSLLFLAARDYERALADASMAIELNQAYDDAYHNRGNIFAASGDYSRAIADYSIAIRLKPDDPVRFNSLGLAYAGIKDFDAAIAAYGRAIALRPGYGEVYNNRGLAYTEKRELTAALADLERAAVLKPEDAGVHVNRGLAYAAAGNPELAEKEYAAALDLKPPAELAGTAHSNRGILRFNQRRFDLALEDFTAAVALNPGSIAAYNNRGAVYRAAGQYALALNDFSKVLELDRNFLKAYLDRGGIYLQTGRRDQAKEDFLSACRQGSSEGCHRVRRLQ